ncbi:unnamed protein product [Peniophora sp. CBMAI 1063]|nr:unnamed protein product [Peniophora sp. CBMAI 1063]
MWMKIFTKRAGTSSSGLPFHRGEEAQTQADAEKGEDGRSGDDTSGTGERGKSGVPTKQIKFESNADGWHRILKRVLHKFTSASTGTPSDGLGGGDGSESSASIIANFHAASRQQNSEKNGADWELDEIIVDNEDEGAGADHDSQHRPHLTANTGSEKGTVSQTGSLKRNFDRRDSGNSESGYSSWVRGHLWPYVVTFFNPHFEEPSRELDYQKQEWYTNKRLAFYASLYLYLNMILYLVLIRPHSLYGFIVYYGGLVAVTVAIPFMVAFDYPVKRPWLFQCCFIVAVWYCAFADVIEIKQCGFYADHPRCHGKDFLEMSYYGTGLPTIALFIASRRLFNAVAQFLYFCLAVGLVIPDHGAYTRNVVNFAIFSIFVQGIHYSLEMNSRRIYIVNNQLKIAYRAQQKAQIAESKASHAKKRFASYIFHEVRVPLNTAWLSYENLKSENAFRDEALIHQNVELYALEASLTMMQQVLNDALDLEKMDAGRFESSPRPFPLHRAVQSVLGPIEVTTASKDLRLDKDLDERIDLLASPFVSTDGLWVVGDEIRLRQVLTNLASNAVKFTPEGGGAIKVVTRLVSPNVGSNGDDKFMLSNAGSGSGIGTSSPNTRLSSDLEGGMEGKPKRERIVFRLEVHDSGPGVRPSDLVDGRLFQPFVQTNVGKLSGKGSGLGLAIVRQIVTLSGGRLGVRSRKGQGAIFWVEFSYPIASQEEIQETLRSLAPTTMPPVTLEKPVIPNVVPVGTAVNPPLEPEPEKAPNHKFVSFVGTDAPYLPPQMTMKEDAKARKEQRDKDQLSPHDPRTGLTTPPPSNSSLQGVLKNANAPPPAPSPSPGPQVPAPAPSPAPSRMSQNPDAMKVLVVDDDPMTRTLMTRMLTKLGCVVDTAEDGQQCLDAMLGPESPKYDLVSLDNYMPVMTGEETVRRLRSLGRDDLVVGCTGNALSEDQSAYIEAGADRVLTKPIMLKDLKAVLEVARKRRKSAEQVDQVATANGSVPEPKTGPDPPPPPIDVKQP